MHWNKEKQTPRHAGHGVCPIIQMMPMAMKTTHKMRRIFDSFSIWNIVS
ncbi:hypothetical protein [Sporosarcina sp. NCCP-2716]|nr:hypothetical protein [Sporosarcina sp. NCCP-2716]